MSTTPTPTPTQSRGPRPKRTYLVGTGDTSKPLHVEIQIRAREDKSDELSISGTYDGGWGQIRDSLAKLSPGRLAPGWTPAMVDELRAIWKSWHLNGMRASCPHQTGPDWTPTPVTIEKFSIDWDARRRLQRQHEQYCTGQGVPAVHDRASYQKAVSWSPAAEILLMLLELNIRPFDWTAHDRAYVTRRCNRLAPNLQPAIEHPDLDDPGRAVILVRRETKQTNWLLETEHPDGYLSKPCPECGYAYGSTWLSEPLPDAVYAFVDGLPTGDTRSPYEIQAAAFLEEYGITFTAEHRRDKCSDWARADQHWRITLKRGRRSFAFDFWNSTASTANNEDVTAYDALSCLASESGYDDVDDAAAELELSPSKARALVAFSTRIGRFFDDGGMLDALQEIR